MDCIYQNLDNTYLTSTAQLNNKILLFTGFSRGAREPIEDVKQ